MSVWSRFTAWLSGWPESKESKKEKKPKGLNPKERKTRKQGNLK